MCVVELHALVIVRDGARAAISSLKMTLLVVRADLRDNLVLAIVGGFKLGGHCSPIRV